MIEVLNFTVLSSVAQQAITPSMIVIGAFIAYAAYEYGKYRREQNEKLLPSPVNN